jgi:nicotinate-nucleotide adenylyltransferase
MIRLPPHAPGMRIGLYGGSFNPPHAGHRHVGLMALRRLALDRLWWLVTPGNPLKDRAGLPPTTARIAAAQACAPDPRIVATGLEEQIGSYYTLETVRFLERRCPGVRFVWIMGADSLASFQRWRGWREIAETLPMAVVDRPGWTLKATRSRAAIALAPYRRGPYCRRRPARLGLPARAALVPVVDRTAKARPNFPVDAPLKYRAVQPYLHGWRRLCCAA